MSLLESGLVPDCLLRLGIRSLLKRRLRDERRGGLEASHARFRDLLRTMNQGPVAVATQDANEQHYEVPPAFFERVLGPRLKYSAALWAAGTTTLAQAEEVMLALTCERAELRDGQRILELGCGWGSLTLWMAERFPNARITAVSNSRAQRAFILERARTKGLCNLEIITADMNDFEPAEPRYDRVVSVEMFEHMRNHRELLRRISTWLAPGGRLFVHIFTHRDLTYLYEAKDASDWMAREFFTGGVMPSDHLLLHHQEHLRLVEHWRVSGTHYQKTAEAWLANQDRHRRALLELFAQVYGPEQAGARFQRWRLFFLACAELWGYRHGEEWLVSHYLFERPLTA